MESPDRIGQNRGRSGHKGQTRRSVSLFRHASAADRLSCGPSRTGPPHPIAAFPAFCGHRSLVVGRRLSLTTFAYRARVLRAPSAPARRRERGRLVRCLRQSERCSQPPRTPGARHGGGTSEQRRLHVQVTRGTADRPKRPRCPVTQRENHGRNRLDICYHTSPRGVTRHIRAGLKAIKHPPRYTGVPHATLAR